MEDQKKIISNTKEADVLVRQLLNIGEAIYRSGGEISRIEDTLHRMGKAYGALHISVYAITSSIVVTAEFEDDYSVTQIRRITKRSSIDCAKMESLNSLCRECASAPIPVYELKERVLAILDQKPSEIRLYLGQLIAAVAFTIFFGGNLLDAAISGLAVLLICLMQKFIHPLFSAELFFNVFVSFVTGVFVNLISLLVPEIHVNQILIGDIMVLIPGIAITNSIRFILSGDIISSFEKLMDSLMQAFGIAAGFMLSLLLIRSNIVDAVPMDEPLQNLIQIFTAALGTLGFCIIFNLRKRYILIPTVGGILCWATVLLLEDYGCPTFVSALVASIAVGLFGECFSRIIKVPTTILFIPACIPLIPGGNLYYSARAMISSDWTSFNQNLVLLVSYALAIALGLAIVVELEKIIIKIGHRAENPKSN